MNHESDLTRDDHFIPQFYQNSWECSEKRKHVWRFEKKYLSVDTVAIKKNCSEEYLYEADKNAPDNVFEKKHKQEIEDVYCVKLKSLLDRINCIVNITDEDKEAIITLFENFSSRHPDNLYKNPINNAIVSHFTIGDSNEEREKRFFLNILPFTDIISLDAYKVELLFSPQGYIVFSDCITIGNQYSDEMYFPLSPYVVALISKSDGCIDKSIKRITAREIDSLINLYIASGKVTRIFSNNKQLIGFVKEKYIFWKKHINPFVEKALRGEIKNDSE